MKNHTIKKSISIILLISMLISAAFVLSACGSRESNSNKFKTLADLKNCQFALSDGNASYEPQIKQDISGVKFQRYTNYFDTFLAVANGTADAAFTYKYTFYGIKDYATELC